MRPLARRRCIHRDEMNVADSAPRGESADRADRQLRALFERFTRHERHRRMVLDAAHHRGHQPTSLQEFHRPKCTGAHDDATGIKFLTSCELNTSDNTIPNDEPRNACTPIHSDTTSRNRRTQECIHTS